MRLVRAFLRFEDHVGLVELLKVEWVLCWVGHLEGLGRPLGGHSLSWSEEVFLGEALTSRNKW